MKHRLNESFASKQLNNLTSQHGGIKSIDPRISKYVATMSDEDLNSRGCSMVSPYDNNKNPYILFNDGSKFVIPNSSSDEALSGQSQNLARFRNRNPRARMASKMYTPQGFLRGDTYRGLDYMNKMPSANPNIQPLSESQLRAIVMESVRRCLDEIGDTAKGQKKLGLLATRKRERWENYNRYTHKDDFSPEKKMELEDDFFDTLSYASRAANKAFNLHSGVPYDSPSPEELEARRQGVEKLYRSFANAHLKDVPKRDRFI